VKGELTPEAKPASQALAFNGRDPEQLIDYQRNALHSLTRWQYEHYVPQTIVQQIKEDVQELHALNMVAMKSMIEVEVQRHGTDGDMETIFKAFNKFWPGMETRHMEKAMRKQVFQPVKGHVNTLGERWVQMEDQWFKVTDTCYSYPFEEQLESILSNQHFYDALQKHRSWRRSQPQDDKIKDLFDGQKWQRTPFFQMHVDAYTVLFYYDDVTVTNPLGNYKRKVGAF
jgi:hypothetical protein